VTATAEITDRLVARGRARRRTRLAVTLSATVLALLLAGAAWLVWATSVLGVRTVEIHGTVRVATDEVRTAAAIRPGTPLARLDTGAVSARIRRLPAVQSVTVDRQWPHTVSIVVRERVPAAVESRGEGFALVDRTGTVFGTVARRPAGLPLVSAPVDAGAPALRAALAVLDDLRSDVARQVRTVRAGSPDDVELALTRHRTVIWGSPEQGARKAAVLAVLVDHAARKGAHVSVFDVSAPDAPTTRR
jgi:cell division protein FtsQ